MLGHRAAKSGGDASPQTISLENFGWCGDKLYAMVIDSIRLLNHTVPFKPYEIQMTGGKCYLVPHPDFILVAPRGSFVIVVDKKDRPHHLNALLIERASPLNGHQRKRRKRSSRSGPK
jgi:hypothetical protein